MGYKYTKIQEYARIGIWKIKDIILNIIRGFHIEGLQVYEEYKSIQDFEFRKFKKKSFLAYQKELSY